MNDTHTQENLKQKVLEKIEAGEVSMRPKIYFIFSVIISVLLMVLILITSIFLISYTLFSLSISGRLFLLGFGWRGVFVFIVLFPWVVFLVDIVLVTILGLLLKRFRFGYHSPTIFLFAGTAICIVVVSYVVNTATPIHGRIMNRAEHNALPVVGGFYTGLRHPHEDRGVFEGVVREIEDNTFMMHPDTDEESRLIRVITPTSTQVSLFITIGDHVFVAGDIVNGEIHAYGIKKFNSQ
ncbi:MAG: hypothetical protein V4473_01155 [Patescibacteria group bacterium]